MNMKTLDKGSQVQEGFPEIVVTQAPGETPPEEIEARLMLRGSSDLETTCII